MTQLRDAYPPSRLLISTSDVATTVLSIDVKNKANKRLCVPCMSARQAQQVDHMNDGGIVIFSPK